MPGHALSQRAGLLAGLAAFTSWGLVPLFWRQLAHLPSAEILAHRIVWSVVFVGILLTFRRSWNEIHQNPRGLLISAARGLLIAANWLIYIWAVNTGHLLDASMGYFITPVLNLVFGLVIFREKLNRQQWAAILLAFLGVAVATSEAGRGFPWVAIGLAITFGIYSVLRKIAVATPLGGLFLETLIIMPFALCYLWWLPDAVPLLPVLSSNTLLLLGSGVITVFPLLWFAQAARALQLTTLSFIQFLAPTISFLIGVFIFQETFTATRLVAFICIWIGVLIFSLDAWWRSRTPAIPLAPVN